MATRTAAVLAEKLVTMIDRGDTTTRDRDFADVWLLTRRHRIAAAPLLAAITASAQHRDVTLVPVADVLTTLATDRQGGWRSYSERGRPGRRRPPRFADVIAHVTAFADPILEGRVTGEVPAPTTTARSSVGHGTGAAAEDGTRPARPILDLESLQVGSRSADAG
jgi:hypothetical protein